MLSHGKKKKECLIFLTEQIFLNFSFDVIFHFIFILCEMMSFSEFFRIEILHFCE